MAKDKIITPEQEKILDLVSKDDYPVNKILKIIKEGLSIFEINFCNYLIDFFSVDFYIWINDEI